MSTHHFTAEARRFWRGPQRAFLSCSARGAVPTTLSLNELGDLYRHATNHPNPLDQILSELTRLNGAERFADDISLIAIKTH